MTSETIFSYVLSGAALLGYASQWAKSVKDKGKAEQIQAQLESDLKECKSNIKLLELTSACQDGDIKSLNTDIKHIMDALMRIEKKLDRE